MHAPAHSGLPYRLPCSARRIAASSKQGNSADLCRTVRVGKSSQIPMSAFIGAPFGAVFTLTADGKGVERVAEWCVQHHSMMGAVHASSSRDRRATQNRTRQVLGQAVSARPTPSPLTPPTHVRMCSPVGEWAAGPITGTERNNAKLLDRNEDNQALKAEDIIAMREAGKASSRTLKSG